MEALKKRKHHTPEQVIAKLRRAEELFDSGMKVELVCRELEVTEQTYYRWKKQYGGLRPEQAKELKKMRTENARLKQIVADQALDNRMLKELLEGKW